MPRIARLIAPGIPHHVTQRGNRRMPTFFCEGDYRAYLALMAEWCRKLNVAIWAYCLMPNHIHLIAVPETEEGLRRAIGEAHRRDSVMVNRRQKWTGHLWQGRFSSFPMDESYLLAAVKYIEMNAMRAHLVADPYSWQWSSARAHAEGKDDMLVKVSPLLEMVGDWNLFLADADAEGWKKHCETRRTKPLPSNVPKSDGSQRPLGIPTIRDRVAQMAAKLVIEPIFEADFCETSYGFRPKNSAHDAVDDIAKASLPRYSSSPCPARKSTDADLLL